MDVTFDGIKTTVLYIFVALGGIATFGKAIDVIKSLRKPKAESAIQLKKKISEHDRLLADGIRRMNESDERLDRTQRMNQVQCYALKALLSHEINGNSIDKLTSASDQLDRYLIGYKEGD